MRNWKFLSRADYIFCISTERQIRRPLPSIKLLKLAAEAFKFYLDVNLALKIINGTIKSFFTILCSLMTLRQLALFSLKANSLL